MDNTNTTQTGRDEMKLSKAQTEVLEELKNAPLHSDVLEQEVYLRTLSYYPKALKQHLRRSWRDTFFVDAPYFDETAIGWVHCYKNKSTLQALEKKGFIEIKVLGDVKNGVSGETDLVRVI